MQKRNANSFLSFFAITVIVLLPLLNTASAKEIPIVRITAVKNGIEPQNGLIADAKGNLYGVTENGGDLKCNRGCGVVFEVSPSSGGTWTQTVIYAFKGGSSDGAAPLTDLIFDAKGNLFGATVVGGTSSNGTVFELIPGSNGRWTEQIIYNFSNQDGYFPGAHLAFDSKGNLYGSLVQGGSSRNGAVYELSPHSGGSWTENLIYSFTNSNGDGYRPFGGVAIDGNGNVYGTTQDGGSSNQGSVYQLSPNGTGGFNESVIYSFMGSNDGAFPLTPLSIDTAGNLYGTSDEGANFSGTVFELSQSGGKWAKKILYNFGAVPDGAGPSGVVFDTKGNLYGTTQDGGSGCNNPGCGIVFRLSPQGNGFWKETILHQFEAASDGSQSKAGLLLDNANQRLFGTTEFGGGRYGYGTIFEIEK